MDRPTRAGLNELTRDLVHSYRWYDLPEWDEAVQAEKEYARLVDEFRNTPKMRALGKKVEALKKKRDIRRNELNKRAKAVRNKYLAQGATPEVLKMIGCLVDDINEALHEKQGRSRQAG